MTSALESTLRLKAVHDFVVNGRHGIVTKLLEQNEAPEAPGLYLYHASMVNPAFFRENAPSKINGPMGGSGAHYTRTGALWAALGEAVERYSASIPPTGLRMATAEELGDAAIDLKSFILFSPEQYLEPDFKYARPDPRVRRTWAEGFDLVTRRTRFVPAQAVYLSQAVAPSEQLLQCSSTGVACGPTVEAAVLSGLCEVLERDGFGSMWQLGLTPTRLVIDSAMAARLAPEIRRLILRGPLRITLWSLLTDVGVPIILAMAESPGEKLFAVGASCRLDPAKAIDKAVVEALHGFVWGRMKLQSKEPIPEELEIDSPETHLAYYLDTKRRPLVDFLFASDRSMPASELPSDLGDLDALLRRLRDLGYHPIAVDATTEDVTSLGLHVVRCLVPGLHPLIFGGRLMAKDPRRLVRLTRFWGLPFDPAAPHYNFTPHPFP